MTTKATAATVTPDHSRVLLITVGAAALGDAAKYVREYGRPTFHKFAPRAGFAPKAPGANADPSERAAYADAVAEHREAEDDRALQFIMAMAELAFSEKVTRVITYVDRLAVTYDKDAGIYPSVAGADTLLALREISDVFFVRGE